ncbi:MAG TPA: hypothetical protein DHU63_05540 [Candidatus Marinimicrobia bacterium]|nr:hypothetical protein [Candidatus Neomarinimicrobiota bacterium]
MMTRTFISKIFLTGLLWVSVWSQKVDAQTGFDGDVAMDYLEQQCDFGPRVPNTPAAQLAIRYFEKLLTESCDTVILQRFDQADPYSEQTLHLVNVVGRLAPEQTPRIILGAHWDSRPRADQSLIDPEKPIIGANDGASGVAILLEIARQLHAKPARIGVDLVLFDGEDWGKEGDINSYLLGSRYYANHAIPPRAEWVIVLDMVGDADLSIPVEPYSHKQAPEFVRQIWEIARELGYFQFKPYLGTPVFDDHIPFVERFYQAIDIIDFQYPNANENYWHTHEDTPDKCSSESLEAVGNTVLTWIYRQ